MNDGACAEEEQRLEEGVGDEVEHAHGDAAEAEAGHHVAELRDGGVGEDALDVVLRDGDERGEDRGGAPTQVTTVSAVVVPAALSAPACMSG